MVAGEGLLDDAVFRRKTPAVLSRWMEIDVNRSPSVLGNTKRELKERLVAPAIALWYDLLQMTFYQETEANLVPSQPKWTR